MVNYLVGILLPLPSQQYTRNVTLHHHKSHLPHTTTAVFSRFRVSKKKSVPVFDRTLSVLSRFPPPEPHFSILLDVIMESPPKEGMFRVPGSKNDVDMLLSYMYTSSAKKGNQATPAEKIREKFKSVSVHSLCSTLKAYLASVHLLCSSHEEWNDLLEVLNSKDLDELKDYIETRIAEDRRRVLYRVLVMLERMIHQPEIKMGANNLAVVFAPTLTDFDGKDDTDSENPTAALIRHQKDLAASVPMVVTLLEEVDYLFESVKRVPKEPKMDTPPAIEELISHAPHMGFPRQSDVSEDEEVQPTEDSLAQNQQQISTAKEETQNQQQEQAPVSPSADADISGKDLVSESIKAGTNTPPQKSFEKIEVHRHTNVESESEAATPAQYDTLEDLEQEIENEKHQSLLKEQTEFQENVHPAHLTHDDVITITTQEFNKMMNESNISLIVKEELDREMKQYSKQWKSDVKNIKKEVIDHKKQTEAEMKQIATQQASSQKPNDATTLERAKLGLDTNELQQLKKEVEDIKKQFSKYDTIINQMEAKQDNMMMRIDEISRSNSSERQKIETSLESTRSEVRKQDRQIRELSTELSSLQSKFKGRSRALDEFKREDSLSNFQAFSRRNTSPKLNLRPPSRTPPKPPVDGVEIQDKQDQEWDDGSVHSSYSNNNSIGSLTTDNQHSSRSQQSSTTFRKMLEEEDMDDDTLSRRRSSDSRNLNHAQLTEQLERLQKKYLKDVPVSSNTSRNRSSLSSVFKRPYGGGSSSEQEPSDTEPQSAPTGRAGAPRFNSLYSSVFQRPNSIGMSSYSTKRTSPVLNVQRPSHPDPSNRNLSRDSSFSNKRSLSTTRDMLSNNGNDRTTSPYTETKSRRHTGTFSSSLNRNLMKAENLYLQSGSLGMGLSRDSSVRGDLEPRLVSLRKELNFDAL